MDDLDKILNDGLAKQKSFAEERKRTEQDVREKQQQLNALREAGLRNLNKRVHELRDLFYKKYEPKLLTHGITIQASSIGTEGNWY